MKKITATFFMLGIIFMASAQNAADTIELKKSFLGTQFKRNGNNLKMKDLLSITQSNAAAYAAMKKARNNSTTASIIGGAGGFMVGYTLGYSISGKKPNWAVAGIGAGLIGASIPFSVAAVKNAKKGVALYNEGIRATTKKTAEFQTLVAANGVGIKLVF